MYKNAVNYRGTMLAPGSKAFELFHESKKDPKKSKELDSHLKDLARKAEALENAAK